MHSYYVFFSYSTTHSSSLSKFQYNIQMMIIIIMMSHEFEYVWILTLTLYHHSILHERLHCSACQSLIHHDHSPSPSLCHSQTDTSLPFTCSQFILLIIIIYCYPIIMIWYRCLGVFHCWREDAHSVDWGCSCILIQLIHLWLCIYIILSIYLYGASRYVLLRQSSSLSVICIAYVLIMIWYIWKSLDRISFCNEI